MQAVIRHYIDDPVKWDQSAKRIMTMIEQHRLPKGLTPLAYLPGVDGRNTDCVWEASSMTELRQFVDRETQGARNEYFELNSAQAIGLPQPEQTLLKQAA
jgi:hypothetical protein